VSVTRVPVKAVYLANRHPRLTRPQFAERWVRHGNIGDSANDPRLQACVSSLRYCLTVDPADILPGATDEHDGVALLALRGLPAIPPYHAMVTGADIPYADELRTFERPVEDTTLYVASEVVVEGAETDVVVLDLARRRADVETFAFLRAADDGRDRELAESGLVELGLRRWVRNSLCAPAARGFAYDAVNELWFDSLDAVAKARDGIERLLGAANAYTERGASTLLVTTVINRIGRDRP
jgi:hypothetical protein